jgi:DNA-binding response OmpR family regulator
LHKRILIVDGDDLLRDSLSNWLMVHHHYRVTRAEGGWEALEHLRRGPCDAVVAEVDMPGMDGLELTRRILSREGPPVILMCARHDRDLQRQVYSAGAKAFVGKPFDYGKLREVIEKVVENKVWWVGGAG